MYKILIIDDDVMIRNGIKNSVQWMDMGIDGVFTAKSGIEGEELFKEHLPDIVLTDIRMPKMDGLELLERVKNIKSDTKVIVLSCYDDFSYAQTALKHGAFDYLLKTAGIIQLTDVIKRALSEINAETERKGFYSKIRSQLNVSLPLLKHRYLNELLWGFNSTDRLLNQLKFVEVDVSFNGYYIAVIEIDDFIRISEKMPEEERLLLKFRVMNIVEEVLGNKGICFESKHEEFIIIYNMHDAQMNIIDKSNFIKTCEEINRNIALYLNITVSMGLSNCNSGLINVRKCYDDAKKALGHQLFFGKGCIICYDDVANFGTDLFFMDIEDERNIISSLRVGDRKQLFETINYLFMKMELCRNLKTENFYKICVELVSLASRVLSEYGMDIKDSFGRDIVYFEEVKKYKTFQEEKQWVLSVFEVAIDTILNTKILKAKKIVEAAVQYIDEHYSEDVTLEMIADMVYVSSNYLSRLFSNEVGQGFMEYITSKRIEKAKQLLGEKDSKAFDVGDRVGYENPQYFSRIFKKYTGMSPIEYKDSLTSKRMG